VRLALAAALCVALLCFLAATSACKRNATPDPGAASKATTQLTHSGDTGSTTSEEYMEISTFSVTSTARVEAHDFAALATAPDDGTLYSVGHDAAWRWEGYEPQRIASAQRVRDHLAVGPEGKLLFVGWRRFALEDGRRVPMPATFYTTLDIHPPEGTHDDIRRELRPRGYELREGRFTPDGSKLVVYVDWRPPRGRAVRRKDGSTRSPHRYPDEAPDPDDFLSVFAVESSEERLRTSGEFSDFAVTDRWLAARTRGEARLLDLEELTWRTPGGQGEEAPARLALSTKHTWLAAIDRRGRVTVWSLPKLERIARFSTREERPSWMGTHPQTDTLVVGYEDGYLRFHDPRSGKLLLELDAASDDERDELGPQSVVFRRGGEEMVVARGTVDCVVEFYESSWE
jgi:hypothetical protein